MPSSSTAPNPALPSHYLSFLSRSYFPLLDGLRCISIIAVVFFHAAGGSHRSGLLSRGDEGVSLFFVISGFLISTILLREQSSAGDISLKRFYLRRALRIFPLYYALLTLYVVLVFLTEKQWSIVGRQFWQNLPYFLTYTSNWFVPLVSGHVIFFFAWSLATEEQFYFFWPWCVKASVKPSLSICAMVGVLGLHYGAAFAAATGELNATWLLTRILLSLSPPICLGAIAAVLLHQPSVFVRVERWIGWRWSATAALIATLTVLAFNAAPDWVHHTTMTWLVVACVLRPDSQPLRQVLMNPLVRHIGVVSYGIYLMHMICIDIVRKVVAPHNGFILFVLALPLSITMATLSYRFFESRFLRLKDRIAKRPHNAMIETAVRSVRTSGASSLSSTKAK